MFRVALVALLLCTAAASLESYIVTIAAPAPASAATHGRRLSQIAESLRAQLLDAARAQRAAASAVVSGASIDAIGEVSAAVEQFPSAGADAGGAIIAEDVSAVFACVSGFAARLSPGAVAFLTAQAHGGGATNAALVSVVPDAVVRAASLGQAEPLVVAAQVAAEAALSWGLDRLDQSALPLDGLYTAGAVGAGVDVYVLDSGVRASHAEFSRQGQIEGANFVAQPESPPRDPASFADCAGHGTHLSGTILGARVGVAPGARLIAVRIYGCDASGPVSAVLKGVDFVLRRMASRPGVPAVINLSFATARLAALDAAVASLIAAGAFVAAAAGNSKIDACGTSPAADPNVLTVASTDADDALSSYSSFGPCVALAAPGRDIVSAWYGNDVSLARMSGTSMSSPHAAGVLALLLEQFEAPSAAAMRAALVCSASPLGLSDPAAAADGTPPLLLFSSPRGLAPACWPSMAAERREPAARASQAPPAPGTAAGAGAGVGASSGALRSGRISLAPALALGAVALAAALLLL